MLTSAKVLINKAILIILFSFFIQSSAIATEATLLKVGSWGSNSYLEQSAFIGDYVFHAQRDSNLIDVQSLDVNSQDALVNQIEVSQIISAIYAFREYLVVTTSSELLFFDISDLNNPVSVYSVSVRNPIGWNKDIYYVDGSEIVFVDGESKVFLIEYQSNEFELKSIYQGRTDDYNIPSYVRNRSIAIDDGALFYAYQVENFGDDTSKQVIIEHLESESDSLVLINQFVHDVDNNRSTRLLYMGNGNFVSPFDSQKLISYVAGESEYSTFLSDDISSNLQSLNYNDDKLWLINNSLEVTILNAENPSAVFVEHESFINTENSRFSTNTNIYLYNERAFLRSVDYFSEIDMSEESIFTEVPLYSQTGASGVLAVEQNRLFMSKGSRLYELDILNPIDPTPTEIITFSGSYSGRNFLQNGENVFISDIYNSRFQASRIDEIVYPDGYLNIYPSSSGTLVGTEVFDNYIFTFNSGDTSLYRFKADSLASVFLTPDEINIPTEQSLNGLERMTASGENIAMKINGSSYNLFYFQNEAQASSIEMLTLELDNYFESFVGNENYLYILDFIDGQILSYLKVEEKFELAYVNNLTELGITEPIRTMAIVEGYLVLGNIESGSKHVTYMLKPQENGSLNYISKSEFGLHDKWNVSSNFLEHQGYVYETSQYSGILSVYQVNKAPVLDSTSYELPEDTTIDISLSSVSVDPEGDAIDVEIIEPVVNGSLSFNVQTQVLTFDPEVDFYGEASATIAISDEHGNSVETLLDFDVSAVNDEPVLSVVVYELLEDERYEGEVGAIDPDGDDLTYSLIEDAQFGEFSLSDTGAISYQPDENFFGADSVVITVEDPEGLLVQETLTFDVQSVDDAPIYDGVTSIIGDEDTSLSLALSASDVDSASLTFSVVSAPEGWIGEVVDSQLNITPAMDANGAFEVVIAVSDDTNIVEKIISVELLEVNDAPSYLGDAAISGDEDVPLSLSLLVSDIDSDRLAISIVSSPEDWLVEINESNLNIQPLENATGVFDVVIAVSDGVNSTEQAISVSLIAVDDAPLYDGFLTYSGNEDIGGSVELSASDVDSDTVTFSIVSFPDDWAVAIEDELLNFTPAQNVSGKFEIVISVSDGVNSFDQAITIDLAEVDDEPVFTSDNSISGDEDSDLSIELSASDNDSSAVTYSIVSFPEGWLLEIVDKILNIVPAEDISGAFEVIIAASDGTNTVQQVISVELSEINDAPVVESPSVSTNVIEGQSTTVNLAVTDVDSEQIVYEVTTLPSKGTATISADGVLTYRATAGSAGIDSLTVTATDDMGEQVSIEISLSVAQSPSSLDSESGGSMPLFFLIILIYTIIYRARYASRL